MSLTRALQRTIDSLQPTTERPEAAAAARAAQPGGPFVVPLEVLDVEIAPDLIGGNEAMLGFSTPVEMNTFDPRPERLQRLALVYGAWYAAGLGKATVAIREDQVPDTMAAAAESFTMFTEEPSTGRVHFYRPRDSRDGGPPENLAARGMLVWTPGFNTLCDVCDDTNRNNAAAGVPVAAQSYPAGADAGCKSSPTEKPKNASKWLQLARAGGAVGAWCLRWCLPLGLAVIILWQVNELLAKVGLCGTWKEISRTKVKCPDGTEGDRVTFQAGDCSIVTCDPCTGICKVEVKGPGEQALTLLIAGVLGIGGLAVLVWLLTRPRREERKDAGAAPPK